MKTMLKISTVAASILLLYPMAPASAEQTPGWYAGGGIGGTFTPDADTGTGAGKSVLQYNPGFNYEASTGYSWNNGFRTELEVFHSRADLDKISGGVGGNNGHLSNTDLFANGFYDLNTGTMYTPYIGAGIGAAYVNSNHIGNLKDGSSLNGTNIEFAYQGIVGVSAQLDDNWSVTADYRYIGTPDPKVHTSTGRGVYTENQSHNILLGIRYSLDTPEAPIKPIAASAPIAHTPMVGKPVVAAVAQSYMVFFDFDKAILTPEAQRILASAASDFKNGGYIRIVVTGHTDTVGSKNHNQKLSDQRAAAIKSELQKLGVNVALIKAIGVGKKDLLVPTQDGVREAQNRRGEIVFSRK